MPVLLSFTVGKSQSASVGNNNLPETFA